MIPPNQTADRNFGEGSLIYELGMVAEALLKAGILLEVGFDQVAPNRPCTISSWAYELAVESGIADLTDTRAVDVPCYEPGYTFVEKLQTTGA